MNERVERNKNQIISEKWCLKLSLRAEKYSSEGNTYARNCFELFPPFSDD